MNNTGNAVPSTSPLDLQDNAVTLDQLINGDSIEVTSRKGKKLKGIAALQAIITSLDLGNFTFADTASGLTGTTNGQYFRVPQGESAEESFIYYVNNNGSAETVAVMIGKNFIFKYLNQNTVGSASIPLFVDSAGSVPVWLSNGKLDAAGLGDSLKMEVATVPNNFTPVSSLYSGAAIPLVYDSEGNVAVWISNGELDAAGLGQTLQGIIKSLIPESLTTPKVFRQEGYGFKLKQKLTQKSMGAQVSINIALTGDSWTEMSNIPQALINSLGGSYKDAGWIPASTRTDNIMAGISISANGMTSYDADNEHSTTAPLYGCGPDGNGLYTVSSSGSATFKNIPATDLEIYYYDGDGTLTIDIDGNQNTVVGKNSGNPLKFSVSNLSSNDLHTVTITTSSSGVCSILGMYAKNSAITSGFSVSRMGNGGAIGSDYNKFGDKWIYPIAKDFDLDLVIVILGTNDFRKSQGVDEYKAALELIISKYRLSSPNCAICLVSPAQANATGTPPLSDYDATMQLVATDNNIHFFSGYNLFPAVRDNAISGMWYNDLHLGTLGSRILSDSLVKTLELN